jgi:hypothetical protein
MATVPTHPPFDLLLAAGEEVAARPEVNPSMMRQIFEEAAPPFRPPRRARRTPHPSENRALGVGSRSR